MNNYFFIIIIPLSLGAKPEFNFKYIQIDLFLTKNITFSEKNFFRVRVFLASF